MKKVGVVVFVVLLSVSFVSAGWFGDLWGRITGRVVGDDWCDGADLNMDGVVDNSDLVLLQQNFNCNDGSASCLRADLDVNGIVNMDDFVVLKKSLGVSCGASAIGSISFDSSTPADGASVEGAVVGVSVSGDDDHYVFLDWDRSNLLWMNFENGAVDSSSYGRSSSVIGNAVSSNSGKFGKGFGFDGGDYIDCGNSSEFGFTNSSSFTLSSYVYFNDVTKDSNMFYKKGAGNAYWLLRYRGSQTRWEFMFYNGISFLQPIDNEDALAGKWYHVLATYDGTDNTATLYINGEVSSSRTISGYSDFSGTGSLQVGRYVNGRMDEVLVFNRVLSESEIKSLYDAKANSYSGTFDGEGEFGYQAKAVDIEGNVFQTEERTVRLGQSCVTGQTRSCGSDIGICDKGVESCMGDLWSGECVGGINPSEVDLCYDNLDNDCDGEIDENCSRNFCAQSDIDGDGDVDLDDFSSFKKNFGCGSDSGICAQSDIDGDGDVDLDDFYYLKKYFGLNCGDIIQTNCLDGTDYGSCSYTKPLFCDEGNLVENCSVCGCGEGLECVNETCVMAAEVPEVTENIFCELVNIRNKNNDLEVMVVNGTSGDDDIRIFEGNVWVLDAVTREPKAVQFFDEVAGSFEHCEASDGMILYGNGGDDSFVSVGDGSQTVYGGEGFDSFWVDGTDNVADASSSEEGEKTVHKINEYYQPWSTDLENVDYVGLDSRGEDLRDPAGATFADYSSHLLFGDDGEPEYNDVRQGSLGDCYFLATLATFANERPEVIKQAVVEIGDGNYIVRYYNWEGVEFHLKIDGDLPSNLIYAKLGRDGSNWVPLLEKAFAYFRYDANSYASLDAGWPSGVFQALTNEATESEWVYSLFTDGILYSTVKGLVHSGKPDTFVSDTASVGRIVGSHVYAVYNAIDPNKITFYNPWGFDGRGSDENTGDGLIELDESETDASFRMVTYGL